MKYSSSQSLDAAKYKAAVTKDRLKTNQSSVNKGV